MKNALGILLVLAATCAPAFSQQQLDAAGVVDTVKGVGFYHGGDVLYTLSNTAGTWHEDCLEQVNEG